MPSANLVSKTTILTPLAAMAARGSFKSSAVSAAMTRASSGSFARALSMDSCWPRALGTGGLTRGEGAFFGGRPEQIPIFQQNADFHRRRDGGRAGQHSQGTKQGKR